MISVICFCTVKWLNRSIEPIDGTLRDTTTLGQSGPGSNDNEEILHIPQSSRKEDLMSYSGDSFGGVTEM